MVLNGAPGRSICGALDEIFDEGKIALVNVDAVVVNQVLEQHLWSLLVRPLQSRSEQSVKQLANRQTTLPRE
jgi:hypothetical protein